MFKNPCCLCPDHNLRVIFYFSFYVQVWKFALGLLDKSVLKLHFKPGVTLQANILHFFRFKIMWEAMIKPRLLLIGLRLQTLR